MEEETIAELEQRLKHMHALREQGVPFQAKDKVDACNRNVVGMGGSAPPPQYQAQELRPATHAESAINRLDEKVYRSAVDGEKAARIREILTRHPEFFEFLEVLNSGLV